MRKLPIILSVVITIFAISSHANENYNFEEKTSDFTDKKLWEEDANYYSTSSDNNFEEELGNSENAAKVNIRPCRHILYPTYAGTGN